MRSNGATRTTSGITTEGTRPAEKPSAGCGLGAAEELRERESEGRSVVRFGVADASDDIAAADVNLNVAGFRYLADPLAELFGL